ncbi:Glycosyl transferase family 2 [Chitinophaga jiangningensis]|uniref:Glycosyl transferase family 2 n=1 Tax=Chitinophaga jiangningensis TaxID=1419482 RepID=A0A1M7IT71_9BACT|nr:glycosyltransferase family 2 protein [Chitinophaga jiangningensis]SHM43527.1 Glycosyl transferase family 2 [Chitinophaga jiangningensis]
MKKLQFQKLVSFTIITVVKNGAKFLKDAIKSIRDQQYPHIEYIVIDGASIDGTIDIIQQNNDIITKWISEADNGISEAMNKGIQQSTNEIIGIIHSDDWYMPNILQPLSDFIFENPSFDVYYGKTALLGETGSPRILPLPDSHLFLKNGMTLAHPSVFIRREAYQTYGTFENNFKIAMDYELLLRFIINGARFKYFNQQLAYHRPGGISNRLYSQGTAECKLAQHIHLHKSENKIKI